jgi:glutathione S-transferase
LDEVKQGYTREDWGRGYSPTSAADFVKVSAFGVVPVIDDSGFILRESQSIVRYLAAKHGRNDLYPSDLQERALVEMWMDWAATDLYAAARPVFHAMIVNAPDPQTAVAPADGSTSSLRARAASCTANALRLRIFQRVWWSTAGFRCLSRNRFCLPLPPTMTALPSVPPITPTAATARHSWS